MGMLEGALFVQGNIKAVHDHGADRPGGAQSRMTAVMAKKCEGTVDAAGDGKDAAAGRRLLDRQNLVGGDRDAPEAGAPERPGFLELLEIAQQGRRHGPVDMDGPSFAHRREQRGKNRKVMDLQWRRQDVTGNLIEQLERTPGGVNDSLPDDGVALPLFIDGYAYGLGHGNSSGNGRLPDKSTSAIEAP